MKEFIESVYYRLDPVTSKRICQLQTSLRVLFELVESKYIVPYSRVSVHNEETEMIKNGAKEILTMNIWEPPQPDIEKINPKAQLNVKELEVIKMGPNSVIKLALLITHLSQCLEKIEFNSGEHDN